MKKRFKKEDWEITCKGYVFTGCALRQDEDNNESCIAYIQLKQDLPQEEVTFLSEEEINSGVLCIYEEQGKLCFGLTSITHFESPIVGVCMQPVAQGLTVANNINGTVLPIGGGRSDWDYESLSPGMFPQVSRLRCIDGYAWSAGGNREVYKRIAIGKWENVSIETEQFCTQKRRNDSNESDEYPGFSDIDGFNNKDIFAVGGMGDVWHYDGKRWTSCDFPSKERLFVVCCADDQHVYIGSKKGVWKKTADSWTLLFPLDMEYPLHSCRWFQEKLWISHDCGIIVWDGNEVKNKVIYKEEELPLSGFLDTCGKWLIVCSFHSVWTFDGTDWYNIIPDFRE